jgi:hypothetical protein
MKSAVNDEGEPTEVGFNQEEGAFSIKEQF